MHFGSLRSFPDFLPRQLAIRTSPDNTPHKHHIVKGVIRWRPVIRLGISHVSMRDDAYEGCWILKDSIVYGNTENMHHDEGHYVRAEEFTPERYEGWDKSAFEYTRMTDAMERDGYVYGGGSRVEVHSI